MNESLYPSEVVPGGLTALRKRMQELPSNRLYAIYKDGHPEFAELAREELEQRSKICDWLYGDCDY